MPRALRPLSLLLACFTLPLAAQSQSGTAGKPAAQATAGKPTLTEADYSKFESVSGNALSPDGKWLAYVIGRGGRGGGRGGGGGPGVLHYRALGTDTDKTITGGSNPAFTSNNRWMFYTQAPDTGSGRGGAGGRGARGGGGGGTRGTGGTAGGGAPGGSTRAAVGIVDLGTGTTTILHDVESYVLSNDGDHVALRRYAPVGRLSRGADLVIREIATATDVTLGNVAEFAWNEAGGTLAMVIDVEGKTGNGVQIFSTASNTITSLDAGDMLYSSLRWRAKSDEMAVMRSRTDTAFADTSYTVIAWKGVSTARPTKLVYDFANDNAVPKDLRVAGYRAPQWSKDGSTLFFGIAPRELKPVPAGRGTGPNPAKVEVWHWKDLRPWHAQAGAANQERTRTQLVAWRLGQEHIVRLGDEKSPNVTLSDDQTVGLISDEEPYFMEAISSGRNRRDVYTVDIATGKRTKVLTRAEAPPSMSPSGRYLTYTQGDEKGGNWFVLDRTTGSKVNLTGQIRGTSFVNMEDDHPVSTRRGYGVAGWITGEKSLVLYDRFDLWQVNVDGTNSVRLTRGKEDSTVYRADWTGYDDPTIDPAKPFLLTATGEFNKKSGYARLTLGQPAQRLLWLDKSVGGLAKAKNADVFTFTEQTFAEAPQLHVSTGAFADAKQVTRTNEWLKDFAWGKQVLMNYTNKRGDKLQMMLTYPADYQPGRKYPMVVYYYEKLSQGFHTFVVPTTSATYNITTFSQAGYFVLRPDIKFQARDPGYSGLDCVTAAVKTALAAVSNIDPKKVGNFGHSWGGYQSAFYAVHSNGVFAASIAGAPLTNLISMYGYTNPSGGAETGHFETGQERMQVSLWEDPAAYIRNSTVFQMDSLKIPLLLEEGDSDSNVNYYQSMELYNFGRRLGKQVVFLVYEGENHSPAGDAAIDYRKRQLEWFGYWLKGEPAADWILNGESYLARKKILDAASPPQPVDAGGGAPAGGGRGGGGRGGGGRGGRGGGQ